MRSTMCWDSRCGDNDERLKIKIAIRGERRSGREKGSKGDGTEAKEIFSTAVNT